VTAARPSGPTIATVAIRTAADVVAAAAKLPAATLHEAAGRIGALPSAIKPVAPAFRCAGPALTVHSPGGRLGLLVFVAGAPLPPPLPKGNEFPSEVELRELLAGAGFAVGETAEADLSDSPPEWGERADAVDAEVARRHGDDEAFRQARENSTRVGRLLADGGLRPWLGIATAS